MREHGLEFAYPSYEQCQIISNMRDAKPYEASVEGSEMSRFWKHTDEELTQNKLRRAAVLTALMFQLCVEIACQRQGSGAGAWIKPTFVLARASAENEWSALLTESSLNNHVYGDDRSQLRLAEPLTASDFMHVAEFCHVENYGKKLSLHFHANEIH